MKRITVVAAMLFSLVALAHLVRVLFGWRVTVAGVSVPQWLSIVAVVISVVFAMLSWSESRKLRWQDAEVQPALPITPCDRDGYSTAIALIEQQVQIFWLVFGAFLLAETVLLGGIVSIAKEGPKELVVGGAALGLALAFPWWTSFRDNHAFYRLRIEQAKAFEPACGVFFTEGARLAGSRGPVRGVKMPMEAHILPPRHADTALIGLFLLTFLALIYYAWRADYSKPDSAGVNITLPVPPNLRMEPTRR